MPLDGSAVTASSQVHTGDGDYLRARAVQEQVAAQKAASDAARDRHDQLAAMYRFRAMMLDRSLGQVVVAKGWSRPPDPPTRCA